MQKLINFWYTTMEGPWAHYVSHFSTCFMGATIIGQIDPRIGLAAGLAAAVGKELLDKYTGRGTPQISAALVSAAGAVLAWWVMQ